MKLTIMVFFLGLMGLSASTYSQKTKLSLDLKNVSIKDVLQSIESQSEFVFIYENDALKSDKKISITANESGVDQILKEVLKNTGLSFKIIEKQVVITMNSPIQEIISLKSKTVTQAQQLPKKLISGVIKDSGGLPLPGVTILVKGTNLGTISDSDGQFRFSIPLDAKILVFSFIGMKAQEITVADKAIFNIVLEDTAVGIDEVVVVGYGIQKKESVVGAISQVNNQALIRSGTSNVTNALAGKLSGVYIRQESGEPGNNDAEIIIRGVSSWNGSAPLVLVDGVERDFSTLDPNEINAVSVLKDASATAVFGAKGANGVIIVTTKRGNLGKPKLDFTASYGLQTATMIPEHISSYTTMSLFNVANMNGAKFQDLKPQSVLDEYLKPSTPLNALRYPDVNWFDELTKSFAPTFNINFNVSGGTNFVKYFCSLGYHNEGSLFNAKKEGIYDLNYNYKRFNYRTNVDFQLTKSTTLSFNLGGVTDIRNSPTFSVNSSTSNLYRSLYSTSPARYPAYFPAWVLDLVPDPDYPDDKLDRLSMNFGERTGNPYTNLHSGQFGQDINSKLFTDLVFNQKLDFVTKGLSFAGKAALSTYFSNRLLTANQIYPEYQLNYDEIGKPGVNPWFRKDQSNEYYELEPIDINVGGMNDNFYRDFYYEFGLNYANTFGKSGKHSVTGLALMNRSQKNQGTQFAYYNEALVGRATYDFSHKYLMEFNIGYTGSERFAPGNRFGVFPSGAVGWVVSEEKFFKDAVPWVNKLKLRYSDGLTGSDEAGSRWLYMGGYLADNGGLLREDLAPNISAQWEEAHKRDLGLELGLFKNVLTITVDVFDEYRDKMLLTPQNVTMLVANSFKDLNLGKMKKQGFEVEIEFNKTTPSDLNYWVKGIFGYNENRVVFKDDLLNAPEYSKSAGKQLFTPMNGAELTGTGYFTSVDDIHNNASPIDISKLNVGDYKFLDYMVDGNITTLDKYPIAGIGRPPFIFSFSSGFSYKKFDFNFMFQGNVGKYVDFNNTYEIEFPKLDWRVHASQLDYWTPTNSTANHSTLHYGEAPDNIFWAGGNADASNDLAIEGRFWRRADFLRLKEIYAGYNLSSKFLRLAGISNLLFYTTGNNLLTLTNLIEGDPEIKNFASGFYPLMTSVKFGIKVTF